MKETIIRMCPDCSAKAQDPEAFREVSLWPDPDDDHLACNHILEEG